MTHNLFDVGKLLRIGIAANVLQFIRRDDCDVAEYFDVRSRPHHLVVDCLRQRHIQFLALGTNSSSQCRYQSFLLFDGIPDASAQLNGEESLFNR